MVDYLEDLTQLLLCILKLSLAALLKTFTLVNLRLLLRVSQLELFAADLLVCQLKKLVAVTGICVRCSSLRLLSLVNGIEELVLSYLTLGYFISESLLGLKELLVQY